MYGAVTYNVISLGFNYMAWSLLVVKSLFDFNDKIINFSNILSARRIPSRNVTCSNAIFELNVLMKQRHLF